MIKRILTRAGVAASLLCGIVIFYYYFKDIAVDTATPIAAVPGIENLWGLEWAVQWAGAITIFAVVVIFIGVLLYQIYLDKK